MNCKSKTPRTIRQFVTVSIRAILHTCDSLYPQSSANLPHLFSSAFKSRWCGHSWPGCLTFQHFPDKLSSFLPVSAFTCSLPGFGSPDFQSTDLPALWNITFRIILSLDYTPQCNFLWVYHKDYCYYVLLLYIIQG